MIGSTRRGLAEGVAYKWWVTLAVTLAMFMSIMDNTIVNVAIPTMQRAFGADLRAVQWVVTVYMLTQAAVIPTAPYLTARFGATRAYVGTLTAFLLASLLCGFAWNLPSLVVFRLLQGIGGGVLLPMVMILMYQAFPIEERGWATSVMGIPLMVAPAFGPVLGGALVSTLGWPWAFFINVPLGIVAVTIARRVLRRDPPAGTARFDLAGFVTIAGGSAALLYGIATLPNGTNPLVGVTILLAGLVLLTAFALLERRTARRGRTPLLDLHRLRDATFTLSTLALMLYTSAFFGVLFLVPVYLQTVHRESAALAGFIQGALALASFVANPLAGRFSDRLGPKSISLAGVGVATVAIGLMTTLHADAPLFAVAAILALLGLGSACAGQMQVAAMSRIASEEQQEVANGATLVSVLRATAAPLGVTLLSVIVQARSPGHVAGLTAQGLPGVLARREGTLLAMHDGFAVAAALTGLAIALVVCVPARRRPIVQVGQQRAEGARTGAGHPRASAPHGHGERP